MAASVALAVGLAVAGEGRAADIALDTGVVAAADVEPVILEAIVNSVRKGDVIAVATEGQPRVWIKASDFGKLGIRIADLPRSRIGQSEFVGIDQIAGLKTVVDLDQLTLTLDVAPELLGQTTIDLSRAPSAPISPAPWPQGFINYRFGTQLASGERPQFVADVALNVGIAEWVLHSQYTYASGSANAGPQRTAAFAQRDWVESMVRLVAGDLPAAGGFFSRSGTLVGVSVARNFELAPGFVATPVASFRGSVTSPTTADVYVDGARVQTVKLNPGVYDLTNLSYFAGLRNVEIVLTDRFGNRSVVALPFYFADQNLRAGLSDFAFNAGTTRYQSGDGDRYADPGAVGFYRYGLTDWLTLGVDGDVFGAWKMLGASASIRSNRFGAATVRAAASTQSGDRSGAAGQVVYSFSAGPFSAASSARYQSRDFERAQVPVFANPVNPVAGPLRDAATLSLSLGLPFQQSASVDVATQRSWNADRRNIAGMRYSVPLARGFALNFSAFRRDGDNGPVTEGAVNLSWNIDRDWNFNSRAVYRSDAGTGGSLQLARNIPAADGYGGRAGVEYAPDAWTADLFAQWNQQYGTTTVSAQHVAVRNGPALDGGELAYAGSLAWLDGSAFASRPIDGSFAVVDASGLPGVRVYQNNQYAGTTGRNGRVLLPVVPSYTPTQVRIEDQDIPLDIQLAEVMRVAVPRALSGTLVKFEARKVTSVGGRLYAQYRGARVPVAEASLNFDAETALAPATTGPDGDFYIEDLAHGREYRVRAILGAFSCDATIRIPESTAPFQDLGELDCVNVVPF